MKAKALKELTRIKDNLANLRESDNIKQDKDMLRKLTEVEDTVGRFQTRKIDSDMIEKVMNIQNLIAECND